LAETGFAPSNRRRCRMHPGRPAAP